jgi:hypothetical protein
LPTVEPDPLLTPRLVAQAVLMAARGCDSAETRQRQFLEVAWDVVEGRSHWNPPAAS